MGKVRARALSPAHRACDHPLARSAFLIGVAVVLAANTLVAPALAGQPIVRLSPCTLCALRVSHAASLGSAADPESPADRFHHDIVQDGRGRYFVRAGWPVTRILVYDSDGNLASVWGRQGDGPGEYRNIGQLLMLRGDSLGVLDQSNSRLTVLNADGSIARTKLLPISPYPHRIVEIDDGTLVVAGGEHTAAASGYVMHLVRTDGSASPFVPAGMVLRSRPSASQRRLAADGMTVWAARPDRYELTQHGADGVSLRVLKREVDWFPDRETEGAMDFAREPPAPYLADVRVDEEGFIWTMVRLADAEWAPVEDVASVVDERRYDSIVEVLDPDRGLVLHSQRFPWYGHGFTNNGQVVSQRKDALGVIVLDVWRPERVTGRSG